MHFPLVSGSTDEWNQSTEGLRWYLEKYLLPRSSSEQPESNRYLAWSRRAQVADEKGLRAIIAEVEAFEAG